MARDVAAARALTREAAAAKDRGEPLAEVSSLAKWTASDVAMRVATDAVQLFGGSGYSRETGIERLMRDAKGAQIYEGTNQIHREIVADEVLKRAARPADRLRRPSAVEREPAHLVAQSLVVEHEFPDLAGSRARCHRHSARPAASRSPSGAPPAPP